MQNISIKVILKKIFYWTSVISFIGTLFFIYFFPTGDLSDFVSTRVSEVSQNQVFLQFSELSLDLIPPALKFDQVFVEAPFLPGVMTNQLGITPSISAIINKKPYGTVRAEGLFDGNVKIQIKKGSSTENSEDRQRVIIEAEQLELKSIREVLKMPFQMSGKVNLNIDAQADLQSTESPEMDLQLHVSDFILPNANINTAMGPMTLPELKLGILEVKGRLINGQLIIEQGDVGSNKDDLFGKVKGQMTLGINPAQNFSPMLGAYEFELDLTATKIFQSKAGLFLSLLDAYKTPSGENARFKFKVSSSSFGMPPNIIPSK